MPTENDQKQDDERQILALHEAGDRALMTADLAVRAFSPTQETRGGTK